MDRRNPYEQAVEGWLRSRRLTYVAVDESRRTEVDDLPIKSVDFIVCGLNGSKLLIDVKGRRFPGGPPSKPRRVWECWSTRSDLDGLERWAGRFGAGWSGLLVFAYHLGSSVELPNGTPDLWEWAGERYLLRAIDARAYRQSMRTRSPKWDTVSLPVAEFRSLVRPLSDFVGTPPLPSPSIPE